MFVFVFVFRQFASVLFVENLTKIAKWMEGGVEYKISIRSKNNDIK